VSLDIRKSLEEEEEEEEAVFYPDPTPNRSRRSFAPILIPIPNRSQNVNPAVLYWPGIRKDIADIVDAYKECQFYKPSQLMVDIMPASPFIKLFSMAEWFSVCACD
jgi:hypothetical protein